jgi:ubiquinone/menaquinone biosynthesis C-methylase UbiE
MAQSHFRKLFSGEGKIDFYDHVYDGCDPCATFLRERMAQALLWVEEAGPAEGTRILDAGCGAGRVAQELEKRGADVVGMDYSFGMVGRANCICNAGTIHGVDLLQGDVGAIPFESSSFDVVVCLGVLSYLDAEEKALDEVARVLRPGGTLILSVINRFRLVKHLDVLYYLKRGLEALLADNQASSLEWGELSEDGVRPKTFVIPRLAHSLEERGLTVLEYATVAHELPTLLGREVFSKKASVQLARFVEGFPHVPIVGSLGGMCIFRARRTPYVGGR